MTLARVNPLQAWPDAGPLLAGALLGTGQSDRDLRRACLRGEAWLLASDRMFMVVRIEQEADGFNLLVWAAASRGATDCIREHLPDLESIARGMGAKGVTFITDQKGFERAMGPNWKPRCYVMERRF